MKTSITHAEYLQLEGLKAMAAQLNERLADIVRAGRILIGESPDEPLGRGGHVDDMIYGGSRDTVEKLLRNLHITVDPPLPPAKRDAADYYFDETERAAAASVIAAARQAGWPEAEKLADLETTLKNFAPEAP